MEGTSFGRYRLLGAIGEGGMGQVFKAYDTATDREVALKVLAPQVAQDASFEQRFRREAQVAARLSEPHIVPIHSYGEIDGRLYVDMRLIAGRDLGSVLAECGALDPARVVGIIEQVADALDAAHAINLVHRDIKPSNILLARRDFVYLVDFGIAQDVNATRLTRTGAAIGTFAYMAPERLDSGHSGPSSDIYSLACVLYECLTGELPFPGESLERQIAGHLSRPVPRPSTVTRGVPQGFDEVIARGMAKDPTARYPTVVALAEAARAAVDHQPREIPSPAAMQSAQTQQAAPVPRPPIAAPTSFVPPPRGPVPGDDRLPPAPREQRLQRPINFIAPGVLVMVAAPMVIIARFGDLAATDGFPWRTVSGTLAWLIFCLAFGLVARDCRAGARRVALAARLTSAAAAVGALSWGLLLLAWLASGIYMFPNHGRYGLYVAPYVPLLFFFVLFAFGITVHRPFGWWWSVPASFAGLFGVFGFVTFYRRLDTWGAVEADFVAPPIAVIVTGLSLFILGIATSRTRIPRTSPAS